MISNDRFIVEYLIKGTEKEAYAKAEDICVEQTIEFPKDLVTSQLILDQIIGKIDSFEKVAEGYLAKISFAIEITSFEFTQLLNVIFGNISIKPGIKVQKIDLPDSLLKHFSGPRFGREGIRKLLNVYDRPLLFTALKPMGLSAKELGELAYKFALGGIDIIKDDHGLTNQIFAPFNDRVKYCVEGVEKANEETGLNCIYVPNITASYDDTMTRAVKAKELGAKGIMLAPAITGLDAIKKLADDDNMNLPIFSHPAFQGSYLTCSESGFSHYALLGQITRLAGADGVIYPNFGGRFAFTKEECNSIANGTAVKMGDIKEIFPCPGGGMSLDKIPEMVEVYGKEVIFLMGGGLFRHSDDLVENCRYFKKMVQQF
ncbi:MAG: RuBisCO large subunit C-terminal-like domain-containing protein [bacterium]